MAKCLGQAKAFHQAIDAPAKPPESLEHHLILDDSVATPAALTGSATDKKLDIFEYGGPGVASLPLTERATITNMGTEMGATTSIFPSDERAQEYLESRDRGDDYNRCEQSREPTMKTPCIYISSPIQSDTLYRRPYDFHIDIS